MLHDYAARAVELGNEAPRRREVAEVVERQRLALMLLHEGEQVRAGASFRVVRRCLLRVLAVRELERALERGNERLGEPFTTLEPARDRRIVGGRSRERDCGEPASKLMRGQATVQAHLLEDAVVVRGTTHGRNRSEVLRRCAQQRRTADIDQLQEPGLVELRPVDGELERIEVHAHEVERLDAVLREGGAILDHVAPREDPGVDSWMQRLDPPRQQFRELGDVLHGDHREPGFGKHLRRAATRDELVAEVREPARE